MHRSFSFATAAAWTGAVAMLWSTGCAEGDQVARDVGSASEATPAARFCDSLTDALAGCAAPTRCEAALRDDCTSLTGLLAESFTRAAAECAAAGEGPPLACLAEGLDDLAPTDAQRSLVQAFCDGCAAGAIPGCADVFLGGGGALPPEVASVGRIVLALGDDLVAALEDECASTNPLTCVPSFSSCAQAMLAKQALPDATLTCLVEGIGSAAPAPSNCNAPAGGAGGGGPEGWTPSSGATTASTGGPGATGGGAPGNDEPGGGVGPPDGAAVVGEAHVTVAVEDAPMIVDEILLWPPGAYGDAPVLQVFFDGPGVAPGTDLYLALAQTGADCDQNPLVYRPMSGEAWATYTPADAGCGLTVAVSTQGAELEASGEFDGWLYTDEPAYPGAVDLAFTFVVRASW